MTRGEIEGRRQAMLAIEALRRYMPGCEGARLRNFGMSIGIRDTRKIDAVYNMTETDVREQGRFDDTIGIYPEFIDGYGVLILPTTGRYMQIPYRAMLPKKVKGLLVDGPRHRRRQDRPCRDAQHGLLRRRRPGRRRGGSTCGEGGTRGERGRHRSGAGRTRAAGRAHKMSGVVFLHKGWAGCRSAKV